MSHRCEKFKKNVTDDEVPVPCSCDWERFKNNPKSTWCSYGREFHRQFLAVTRRANTAGRRCPPR